MALRRRPSIARTFAWLAVPIGLAASGCTQADPSGPGRPNLLLVVVDALRPDYLGLYGHRRPTSPAIDRLAARSLVVENAFAQAPWTKPAVASIFTSLHSSQHLVRTGDTENQLDAGLVTLPEVLREAGFSANPLIQSGTGFGQGFDRFDGRNDWWNAENALLTDAAIDWIAGRDAGRPFFVYLHYLDPHDPLKPDADLRELFVRNRRASRPEVAAGELLLLLDVENEEVPLQPLARRDLAYLLALYEAEIRSVDRQVGRLLDSLEAAGLGERTIVALTADHGESFMEHGRFRHGYDLYDEALRIPLVVHVPGAAPRRESQALVQQIDLAPTLLELVGLEPPASFQGASFAALTRGETLGETSVVSETLWRGLERRSIRTRDWKLVVDDVAGTRRLYDLAADPRERRDVAEAHPQVADSLEARLRETAGRPPLATPDGATGAKLERLEQALRKLGYVH